MGSQCKSAYKDSDRRNERDGWRSDCWSSCCPSHSLCSSWCCWVWSWWCDSRQHCGWLAGCCWECCCRVSFCCGPGCCSCWYGVHDVFCHLGILELDALLGTYGSSICRRHQELRTETYISTYMENN